MNVTFNSLSRDHRAVLDVFRTRNPITVAFNSLSRDHFIYFNCLMVALSTSFNSLSRDHYTKLNVSEPLYDPFAFNSLSRDHKPSQRPRARLRFFAFQLPLSGSQTSVPSVRSLKRPETFNSLSRDHRARFRDFSALRGVLPRHPFAQMIPKTTIWIYRFAPL